ncbi:unnamed protein product [Bemisia tabaci]|uniref:Mitochondrial potassium channel ATP-binding subunit n=1 Tax=Bemisia tabaci TaxID=7038 RepID=A0A9P0AIG6_BEMTA|nr:unnamed protein product [Bemisia tabaci]
MLWRLPALITRHPISAKEIFLQCQGILNKSSPSIKVIVKSFPPPRLSYKKPKLLPLCVSSVVGIGTVKIYLANNQALCKSKSRPPSTVEQAADDAHFDWRLFFHLLLPDIWVLVGAVTAAMIVAMLNIYIPIHLGVAVNVMTKFAKNDGEASFIAEMKGPALKLLALYSAQSIFTFAYIYLLAGVGERVAGQMKSLLFQSILKQDLEFFDRRRTGELMDRLTTDVQDFKSAFKMCVSQGLRSSTQVVGCVISLFYLSPFLASSMIILLPTVIFMGTAVGALLRGLSLHAQQKSAEVTTLSEEAITNIRTVRAFAMESQECKLYDEKLQEVADLQIRLGLGIGLFQGGSNLFLNGLVLGTLCAGGHLMATGYLSAGDLMAFLVATQTIQRSLAQISLLTGHFVKGLSAGSRVFELINLPSKMPLSGGIKIPYHSLKPEVEFDHVTFAYPTRPDQVILKDFCLHIPCGKTVAIVGTSGNGKSTIVNLLERFYDVQEGSIKLNGHDLRTLDASWLRGNVIGIINQEPTLFAGTVKENIRFSKWDATDQEVYEAAKLANADSFIRSFPEGYDTVVGERGVAVSGGQKQRIAIARALLKNPSILILDEATSALDSESEKIVQKALEQVCRGRTVVVIAHRLSTIKNADIIIVLQNGMIAEMGDHEMLVKKKGVYWQLMNQQASGANRQAG